ncbi:helix-turn-helix domain-containing protein [Mycobacterium sp. shizuoka-1]|uniref:winged helix-turn-helix transcriptional regulator n=1 Tax=Mycobacterium sp. shizuoka-1 TaxID=2039281 RepID=UPI000C060E1A|nr:helix-turn-helix domain-containing protein [Mycobacterium sp. shizuoka-1]GAY14479.1 HxlR family transcriptional regulator [Mycobacterium sp. shizuoka-1]
MGDTVPAGTPTVLAPDGPNAIGRMLGLLGDEWNLLIVQQALLGASRYSQFMARLPISNSVLTNRLRTLVDDGLLTRKVHASTRARTEYLITERGRSLWPALLSIWGWERNWVTGHRENLPAMCHTACGSYFTPQLRCNACHAAVAGAEVALSLGPSGTWSRSAPAASTRRRSESDATARHAGLFPETMSILGNRWAAALLVAAFLGTTRFTDFQTQLGAPPSLLAERLQTFCHIGVLTTAPTERSGPERAAYLLTEKGLAFFPVLTAALQWAQWWFQAPEGPAVVMTHRECGAGFTGELACDHCTERLSGAEVTPVAI